MGKSGSTGNFIARLLKLMLDRQYRRLVGMVMSILDGQIPCWTSKIYAKLLSKPPHYQVEAIWTNIHKNVSSRYQWVSSTLKYVDWIFWLLSVTAIVWEREESFHWKNGIQKEARIPTVRPVPVPGGWWAVPGSLAPNVSYSWQISLAGLLVNETMEGSVMLYLWSTCSVATPRHSSNSRLWVSFAFSSSYRK